ncbi:ATP-dependent DNA helicase Q4, partial [Lunasporangiospora selenospora]
MPFAVSPNQRLSKRLAASSPALSTPSPQQMGDAMEALLSVLPSNTLAKCQEYFGVLPKLEQLKAVAKIAQGQDFILIADCGWGKSLVYFLPMVLWPSDIILVITPLKALGNEQQQKLESLGISSIKLKKEPHVNYYHLGKGWFTAVFISPE